MTWQELANFINNQMPECNRNEEASIWDGSMNNATGGKWVPVYDITPFDYEEKPSEDNYYSIVTNTEDWWD